MYSKNSLSSALEGRLYKNVLLVRGPTLQQKKGKLRGTVGTCYRPFNFARCQKITSRKTILLGPPPSSGPRVGCKLPENYFVRILRAFLWFPLHMVHPHTPTPPQKQNKGEETNQTRATPPGTHHSTPTHLENKTTEEDTTTTRTQLPQQTTNKSNNTKPKKSLKSPWVEFDCSIGGAS